PCTLASASSSSSSCQVGYRPTSAAGTHTITGAYQGSATHDTSTGNFSLTVTTRSTSTSVTGCAPPTVALNQGSTCTVKVTDTDLGSQSAPAGTASFSSNGTGGFSGSPCTLSAGGSNYSTCTVTYTPSAGAGTHTIKASYSASDSVHTNSADAGGYGLTVTTRSTSTSVTGCAPPTVALNQEWTSTVKVTNTDLGSQSAPAGTASFSSNGTGGFSGSPCTPSAGCSNYSTCTLTYPPSFPTRRSSDLASYSASDSVHTNSADAGGYGLTVTTRSTSTSVTGCAPPTVALN